MTARNSWDGTPITDMIATTSNIVDGNFSTLETTANMTGKEFDNTGSSDNWTSLKLILTATMSADPGDDQVIGLYKYGIELGGGADEVRPELAEANQAKWVGSFTIPDGTSEFVAEEIISLYGVKKCAFSLYNGSGVTLASGATVDVEGLSLNDS